MADKKSDPAPGAKAAPKKKKGGKLKFLLIMILFGASVPFIFPTLVLVMLGMLPTGVAIMTDNDRHKSSVTAVGAMNAAGITPFIIDLWAKGQTMENTFQILHDPMNWLIMLGAAGIGQLIIFTVPQAVASISLSRSEARLKLLRKNLESLKESWGPEVGSMKPNEKTGRG